MSVMIAMPTMGQIHTETTKSLIALTQTFSKAKIAFSFVTVEFSDIVFSRNRLLSQFYQDKKFSHILMLDSDLSFRPEVVMQLLEFGEDFTAATYPQKYYRFEQLQASLRKSEDAGDITNLRDALSSNWDYNIQPAGYNREKWVPEERGGFITLPSIGAGLMLLSRRVPELLIEKDLAKHYPRHAQTPKFKGVEYYDFFSHLPNLTGDAQYGEDQSFCMRWVYYAGEKIWVDPDAWIKHWGNHVFAGRYRDKLDH